jgi:hypothetical protein
VIQCVEVVAIIRMNTTKSTMPKIQKIDFWIDFWVIQCVEVVATIYLKWKSQEMDFIGVFWD